MWPGTLYFLSRYFILNIAFLLVDESLWFFLLLSHIIIAVMSFKLCETDDENYSVVLRIQILQQTEIKRELMSITLLAHHRIVRNTSPRPPPSIIINTIISLLSLWLLLLSRISSFRSTRVRRNSYTVVTVECCVPLPEIRRPRPDEYS